MKFFQGTANISIMPKNSYSPSIILRIFSSLNFTKYSSMMLYKKTVRKVVSASIQKSRIRVNSLSKSILMEDVMRDTNRIKCGKAMESYSFLTDKSTTESGRTTKCMGLVNSTTTKTCWSTKDTGKKIHSMAQESCSTLKSSR